MGKNPEVVAKTTEGGRENAEKQRISKEKIQSEVALTKFEIAKNTAIFTKFFSENDKEAVLSSIPEGTKKVVCIDTPSTPHLLALVQELLNRGIEVEVRDHHDVLAPKNPREQEIADSAKSMRSLVGEKAVISDREANPACSSLIAVGEFASEGVVIIADPDPDGLLGTMKGLGIVYETLDKDASILDGPRSAQTAENLSQDAFLFVRAMSTLPPFDANRPQISTSAKARLFSDFVSTISGNEEARQNLTSKVVEYEEQVKVANQLVETAEEVTKGVVLVDTVGKPRFNLTTLSNKLEAKPGCMVTVTRKDNGPIAAKHGGIQYSLAVAKNHKDQLNLQDLLPEGFTSSPEEGIISNTSFLLHVNEETWNNAVLPALKAKLS